MLPAHLECGEWTENNLKDYPSVNVYKDCTPSEFQFLVKKKILSKLTAGYVQGLFCLDTRPFFSWYTVHCGSKMLAKVKVS